MSKPDTFNCFTSISNNYRKKISGYWNDRDTFINPDNGYRDYSLKCYFKQKKVFTVYVIHKGYN